TLTKDKHHRSHSITSSARMSNAAGTDRPRSLEVLLLITSSYFVGVCTGRSVGFSPLRIRSMNQPLGVGQPDLDRTTTGRRQPRKKVRNRRPQPVSSRQL